ncbi:MAG: TetR family transcriptional regulator C-terminal domain-containing protein [Isosphaeraceae bacterium]
MSKESTRNILLEAGREVFLRRGYANAGIDHIVQGAGIPKGSFYYYFKSKEQFGLAVIDEFAARCDARIAEALDDKGRSPLERIRHYFEESLNRLATDQCRDGCLVGRLGQEMANQNETYRARIDEIFSAWASRLADCVREAQELGELSGDWDPEVLAEVWLSGWQGALLRAKMARSTRPLRRFLDVMVSRGTRFAEPSIEPSNSI